MASLRQIAEEVGLLQVTCRHCRRKTKLLPVFEEFVEKIMEELAHGERVVIPGFGALYAKPKKEKEVIRYGKPLKTLEGVSVRFKLSNIGKDRIQELYDSFKKKFKEKVKP